MGSVQVRVANAGLLKRSMYATWQRRGSRTGAARRRGRSAGLSGALGWILLYRALRQKLGMSRVRIALSGAAPIAPEVLDYWWSLGVPLRETYGQTEDTALATANPAGDVRLGTVGRALPGVALRIADDGEILVRSPGNFVGYLGDDTATRASLDPDGWLRTGDLGSLDGDGYLTVTGRKKEVIVTAGGLNVSPSKIEALLKLSPFISEAMVIGDRRPYLSALIGVEYGAVAAWAAEQDLPFTTEEDLVAKPEVRRLIERQIGETNRALADAEQLRGFELLPVDLGDLDALTATQKLRRARVVEQFGDLIDQMYRP